MQSRIWLHFLIYLSFIWGYVEKLLLGLLRWFLWLCYLGLLDFGRGGLIDRIGRCRRRRFLLHFIGKLGVLGLCFCCCFGFEGRQRFDGLCLMWKLGFGITGFGLFRRRWLHRIERLCFRWRWWCLGWGLRGCFLGKWPLLCLGWLHFFQMLGYINFFWLNFEDLEERGPPHLLLCFI